MWIIHRFWHNTVLVLQGTLEDIKIDEINDTLKNLDKRKKSEK